MNKYNLLHKEITKLWKRTAEASNCQLKENYFSFAEFSTQSPFAIYHMLSTHSREIQKFE